MFIMRKNRWFSKGTSLSFPDKSSKLPVLRRFCSSQAETPEQPAWRHVFPTLLTLPTQ